MSPAPHVIRTRSDGILRVVAVAIPCLSPTFLAAAETRPPLSQPQAEGSAPRALPPLPGIAPGVRGIGLGSAVGRGPDGVGTGACPSDQSLMAGSAATAPLIPSLGAVQSIRGGPVLGPNLGTGPDLAVGPLYGATYGDNLGGGPGSVLAQSSAILGTPCPPRLGQEPATAAAPLLQIPAVPTPQLVPHP